MTKKQPKDKQVKQETVIAYKGFGSDWKCRDFQYEEWRAVPGFEGLYEVSSFGRIRSFPRQTASGTLGGGFLRGSVESNGYIRITLSRDGRNQRISLHRLVLTAFVGACPAAHECRHLNGVRADCRLSNLAWGTRAENSADRIAHGTHVNNKGERHGMTHLTDAQAAEIRLLRQQHVPIAKVAEMFSTSQATVSRIANCNGWRHINEGVAA